MAQISHQSHSDQPDEATRPSKVGGPGRVFFAVVALCLIAVGGVAAVTFSESLGTSPIVSQEDTPTSTSTPITTTTGAAPAAASPATTTAHTVSSTTTSTQAADLFVLPLSNVVLTPFSEQPIYSETMDDYRAHTGVDFDGEEGQPIRSLADGTVTAFEDDAMWGGCLTLDHGDGIVSIYRGVSSEVDIGTTVAVGDIIGAVDAIPCESLLGPHLHLELYQNGTAVDVTALLSAQLHTTA